MFGADERVKPNDREVSSKVIDGEAIIIRLSDGIYYSMVKAGAFVWQLVEEHNSVNDIVGALTARFDVSEDQARGDVVRLFQQLIDERLIVQAAGDAPPTEPSAGEGARQPYESPALNVYRDMGELLALDPPAPGLMEITWSDPVD